MTRPNPDVTALFADIGPAARVLAEGINEFLVVDHKCKAYVKTIYVGYEIDGEMVAALYPYSDSVEVALALPEDSPHSQLIDATHLTWRTLPVGFVARSEGDLKWAKPLLAEAVDRLARGLHKVETPNEIFMNRKKRLADRSVLGKPANE